MLFFAYVYRSLESVNHAKMMMMMMMMMMQTLLVIRRRLLHVINVLRQACFSVRTIGVHNSFIARLFVSDKENLIANAVWWPQLTHPHRGLSAISELLVQLAWTSGHAMRLISRTGIDGPPVSSLNSTVTGHYTQV